MNAVKQKHKSNYSKSDKQKTAANSEKQSCGKCGYIYEHGKLQYPAYGKRCSRCKRFSHFQKMCKTPLPSSSKSKKKHVRVVEDSSDSSDNELYAGMINGLPLNSVNPLNDELTLNSKINDKTVFF